MFKLTLKTDQFRPGAKTVEGVGVITMQSVYYLLGVSSTAWEIRVHMYKVWGKDMTGAVEVNFPWVKSYMNLLQMFLLRL
jgi:hypothetical protein